jgi:hypothetical protein
MRREGKRHQVKGKNRSTFYLVRFTFYLYAIYWIYNR